MDATEIISGIRKSLTFFKNESALLDVKMKTLSAYISMLNHLTKKKVEMCMDFLCLLDGMNRIIKAKLEEVQGQGNTHFSKVIGLETEYYKIFAKGYSFIVRENVTACKKLVYELNSFTKTQTNEIINKNDLVYFLK